MQKTIGLIGGLTWESSALYYKIINQEVQKRLGGVHSCQSLLYSVDFDEIAILQREGEWDKLGQIMADAAQRLEDGGADMILICANTMHKVADSIEKRVNTPVLHIADATSEIIKKHEFKKVGLLGTRFTMEEDFLKSRFFANHNIQTIIPNEEQRNTVHTIIYEELAKGIFTAESKQKYIQIMDDLSEQGAEGIILGCTEIGLLVNSTETHHVLFDTAEIHAKKAVEMALKND